MKDSSSSPTHRHSPSKSAPDMSLQLAVGHHIASVLSANFIAIASTLSRLLFTERCEVSG